MTIDQIIERLSEQYPDSEHQMTVVMFAEWLEKNAQPASEPKRDACTSCDGLGDYHDPTGEWRGYCTCEAGVKARAASEPKPAQRFTCIGKGGNYELLGSAFGAGTMKQYRCLMIYQNDSGTLFARDHDDFWERMQEIDPVPAGFEVVEQVEDAEPRLVSYSTEMATCTLNHDGREYYFVLDCKSDEARPAPAGVVLPERRAYDVGMTTKFGEGWNACLDAVEKLNGAPK
jgi:hypothetical protein